MKKKILLIVSLLVVSLLCFAGCGKKEVVNNYLKEDAYITGYSKVDALDGYTFSDGYGSLALFYQETDVADMYKIAIYNIDKNAIVATFEDSENVTYEDVCYYGYFVNEEAFGNYSSNSMFSIYIRENQDDKVIRTTKLFNLDGELIASATTEEDEHIEPSLIEVYEGRNGYNACIFEFDGVVYTANEKTMKVTRIKPIEFVNVSNFINIDDEELNNCIDFNENHYTFLKQTSFCIYLDSYDANLNFLSRFELDIEGRPTLVPFENGNYLIQSMEDVESDSNDYSYIEIMGSDSYKTKVKTQLVDIKTGKAKDIKTDYVFNGNYGYMLYNYSLPVKVLKTYLPISGLKNYNVNIETKAEGIMFGISKIENKKLVPIYDKMFWLFADGKLEEVEKAFENLSSLSTMYYLFPQKLVNGNFIFEAVNGDTVIFNAKGEEIQRINSNYRVENFGSYYLLRMGYASMQIVMDSNFEKIDTEEILKDYTIIEYINNKFIVYKEDKFYFYTVETKAFEEITNAKNVRNEDLYIEVEKEVAGVTKYDYYNSFGELIAGDVASQLDDTDFFSSDFKNTLVMKTNEDETYSFYLIKLSTSLKNLLMD